MQPFFLYNLSLRSGGFKVVCASIESVTGDRRLQALLIAFCFGAFLEGCAGFGAPVAITTGMLAGLGFEPLYAAGICLLANSAPVAYGSIGIPILTAAQTSGVDPVQLGRMVAHQLPLLSFIVPFWLIILMAGWKSAKEVWPAILVTAASYTLTMYLVATYLGPSLPNVLSAIVSIVSLVLFLRVWKPKTLWRFPAEQASGNLASVTAIGAPARSIAEQVSAWTPFLLLVLFVTCWGIPGIKGMLDQATLKLPMAGLDGAILSGIKPIKVVYTLNWLSAAGSGILLAALATVLIQRMTPSAIALALLDSLKSLRNPIITICSIVGFAYLANYSGMSLALGNALTATGHVYPLLAPIVGWIGVFVSGSDTASNALFSNMQRSAATHLGLNPLLTIAANTDGGVCGKMISPQSIAVAAASAKIVGKEGQMFRRTAPHSLAMLAIICVITYLQAYALKGMVPTTSAVSAAVAATAATPSLGPTDIAILAGALIVVALLAVSNVVTQKSNRQTA